MTTSNINIVTSTNSKNNTRHPHGCPQEHCLGGCQKPSCLKQLRDRKQDLQIQRLQLRKAKKECIRELRALIVDAHARWGVDYSLCDEEESDDIGGVKVKCKCLSCEVERLRVEVVRGKQSLTLLREKVGSLQNDIECRSKEEEQASAHPQPDAANISDMDILPATLDHVVKLISTSETQRNADEVQKGPTKRSNEYGCDDKSGHEDNGDGYSGDELSGDEDSEDEHSHPDKSLETRDPSPQPRVRTARFKGLSGNFCVQPEEHIVASYSRSDYFMHPAREELERQFTYGPKFSRTGSYRHNGAGQLKLGGPRLNSNYAGMAIYRSDQPSQTGKKAKKPMLGR